MNDLTYCLSNFSGFSLDQMMFYSAGWFLAEALLLRPLFLMTLSSSGYNYLFFKKFQKVTIQSVSRVKLAQKYCTAHCNILWFSCIWLQFSSQGLDQTFQVSDWRNTVLWCWEECILPFPFSIFYDAEFLQSHFEAVDIFCFKTCQGSTLWWILFCVTNM